jgi:hypothetical protein
MFAKLSRYARVYITKSQVQFLDKYKPKFPIKQSEVDVEDIEVARQLSAKSVLVRKKLDADTLYNLNKNIRFENDAQDRTRKTNKGLQS